jgi:hypothetical protein
MSEEQDGRGNEIQPIGVPRQRRNDGIKIQREVSNICNVFNCFEKRVQYLLRAFTSIRNVSCLNRMNDYKIREVLRPGTDAVGLNDKKFQIQYGKFYVLRSVHHGSSCE